MRSKTTVFWFFSAVVLLLIVGSILLFHNGKKEDKTVVGVILPGSSDELGWNGTHYQGIKAALCEEMGMKVAPKWNDPRTDIVQTVTFGEPDPMVKFCAAIQHYSPMNSFVDPIPYHQDGYEDDVVMASGSFTEGSTIRSVPLISKRLKSPLA